MCKIDGTSRSWERVRRLMAVAVGLCASLGAWANGVLTIVDGEATVIDGARAWQAVEGMAIGKDSIVRTTARTQILRVEWPDGTVADLGPETTAMFEPSGLAARGAKPPLLYLLRGWAKLGSRDKAANPGLTLPALTVQPFKGALVASLTAEQTWVFAEAGALQVTERDLRPPVTLAMKGGQSYERIGQAKGTVAARPTAAQMHRVPRGFRDTLPLRLEAVKDRQVEPQPAPLPSYEELAEWLSAEPAIRRAFPRRFAARARESAFRSGLAQHLGQHPEWEPVLFPERFIKPTPSPSR